MLLHRRHFLGRLAGLTGGLALLPWPPSLTAAPKKRKVSRPLTKKGRAAELPVVKNVTNTSITVGDKFYEVNEFTDVVVNGEKAGISDVKPGMQVSIAGGVRKYGKTRKETIYKASRIVARGDNQLAKKAAQHNKKVAEQNRKANQQAKKNRNRR